jgi:hypothetical protein
MEIKINKLYSINSTWNYEDRTVLVPVPNNIVKIIDITNNDIAFEYIDSRYDYKFLLSSDEFIKVLNPIMIKENDNKYTNL